MLLDEADCLLVVGIKGSGKTFWTTHNLLAYHPRILLWDWHREYAGFQRYTIGDLARAIQNKTFKPSLPAFRVAVTPTRSMEDPYAVEDLLSFVRVAEASFNDTLVIIEECGVFAESKKAQQALVYLATQSRHWQCPNAFIAQYAFLIPKGVRRQSSKIVSFRQHERSDLDALRERMGELAGRVPTLLRGQYVYWSADEMSMAKPVQGKLF